MSDTSLSRDPLKQLEAKIRVLEEENARMKERVDGIASLQSTIAQLADTEAQLRNLVDSAAVAFYIVDTSGRIIDANPHACTSLGYTREELVSLNVREIDASFTAREIERIIESLGHGEKPVREAPQRRRAPPKIGFKWCRSVFLGRQTIEERRKYTPTPFLGLTRRGGGRTGGGS